MVIFSSLALYSTENSPFRSHWIPFSEYWILLVWKTRKAKFFMTSALKLWFYVNQSGNSLLEWVPWIVFLLKLSLIKFNELIIFKGLLNFMLVKKDASHRKFRLVWGYFLLRSEPQICVYVLHLCRGYMKVFWYYFSGIAEFVDRNRQSFSMLSAVLLSFVSLQLFLI